MADLTLADLKNTFDQQLAKSKNITLDKSVLTDKTNLAFIATLPDEQLVLVDATATLDQTPSPRLTVVGTAEPPSDPEAAAAETTSTPQPTWLIPGVDGAGLTDVVVSLVYVEKDSNAVDTAMTFEAAFAIGQQQVLCTGTLADDGGLKFALKDGQTIQAPLAAVANVVTGSCMTADYLPTGVAIFASMVPVTSIDLTFGLSGEAPTQLRLSSDVGGPWHFVDGIDLRPLEKVGLRLFSTYTPHSGTRAQTSFGADIHADFELAGHSLEARLAFTQAEAWEISLLPTSEHGTLPGLVDVAGVLGVKELVQTGLSALGLGDIAVLGVEVVFDPNAHKLLYFSVAARVQIVNVDFDLWIRLPDFQFGGGLARGSSISFRRIVDHFFSAAHNLPDVIVEEFSIAAHPSAGTYSLTVALLEEGFALGPVTLEGLQLAIEKTSAGFDGSMDAMLTIANSNIQVTVGHPQPGAGWQFEGRTTASDHPLKVSELVNDTIDTLFPGSTGAKSGVPAILDVAIKAFDIKFDTKTRDFYFDAKIDFGAHGVEVDTKLTFSNLHQEGTSPVTYERRATGEITVFPGKANEIAFDLGIDLKPDSKHFIALYSNTTGRTISLGSLVKAMFPGWPDDKLGFEIAIRDAIVGYVSTKQDGKPVSQVVFALDMDASLDLSGLGDIPLVGASLTAAKTLKLAVQLVYPTAEILKADLDALNSLITVAGPRLPAGQNLSGLFIKTELRLGDGAPIDFNLPVKIDPDTGKLAKDTSKRAGALNPPGSQATDDGTTWFRLDKTFGPVHLQRAGLKFDSEALEISALLDGGLTAFGLQVDLQGLSATSKISNLRGVPHFSLGGLGIRYAKGGVEIAGAFLHRNGEYDGLVGVQAEGMRLAAIGSLTKTADNQPSLFIYAVLDYPLGGPPFFYVTGLAAGFGLNRRLVMPPVDEVAGFPLVKEALSPPKVPTDAGGAGKFISDEMSSLGTHLVTSVGQYFGCAGVRFTSFKLLDSFILVSISFGREFELDLLGLSTLLVPPQRAANTPPLAMISLQIAASFIPDEGLAIVQGQLTKDSHVLDPNCHITGGFAFATWFGPNSHAGDFVVSLGGYHPDFQTPSHYPTVPRIGVNWQVVPELSVTGGLYFALTPHSLMAGVAMRAIFQLAVDLKVATVDVKAWFILGVDFIAYWKPFHYSAGAYIDMGIDIVIHFLGTHDIGLDVGADLTIWGPPFRGHAHVSLTVIGIKIGFDVEFGARAETPPALHWNDEDASKSFRRSFLPADDQIVSVAIADGLIRKIEVAHDAPRAQPTGGEPGELWHIINPKDFRVRTSSVIPIRECDTKVGWAEAFPDSRDKTAFGIAPMSKSADAVTPTHRIEIKLDGHPAESHFAASPLRHHVPAALWAPKSSSDINAQRLIENAAVGFEIVPAQKPTQGEKIAIDRDRINFKTDIMDDASARRTLRAFGSTLDPPRDNPAVNREFWEQHIQAGIHQNPARDAMLAAMGFGKFDIGESFSTDAAYAPRYGTLSS